MAKIRAARTSLLIVCVAVVLAPPIGIGRDADVWGQQCVFTHGYWRTHSGEWPVQSLVLGDASFSGHTYQFKELLSLLDAATKGDASLTLAAQLIAAKLNIAHGANGQVVASALSGADTLLGAFRRRLPYNVKSNTPAGSDMAATAKVLEDFNRGLVNGSCGSTNTPPVANAGSDQRVSLGATVTLDAGASSDADGHALTYAWSFVSIPSGSSATLAGSSTVNPTFVADQPGTYEVRLVVHDGSILSQPSTVRVTTENARPVAAAGADQTVMVTAHVQLDGSGSTDPDGDTLTYAWSLIDRPAASSATLQNATAVNPTFAADVSGNFTVQLIVSDGALSSVADLVVISTSNSAPVADAGADATGQNGATITLDGGGSTDVDGDALTYRWTLLSTPDGSGATLSDDTTVSASFTIDVSGVYVAQLIVNDGTVDSAADTVTVTTVNSKPIANAGSDRSSQTGVLVELDGSGSTDVDGDSLSFEWSLTTLPAGSQAVLSDPTAIKPTFIPDLPGTYVAQLIVRDASTASDPDTVSSVVALTPPGNQAPIAEAGPPQTVQLGQTVTLDGTASSDPDNDPLTYQWSLSAPAGSAATLSNSGVVSPTFVVDVAGTYVAQLIVNDGALNSAPDTVSISTENSIPVADAGDDRAVASGATVQLDGSGSFDADGSALSYAWSLTRPAGSAAVLSNTAIVNPMFVADVDGTYVAQLIVNDGTLASAPDTATITAGPGADISVAVDFAHAVVPVGREEQWFFRVVNLGPAPTPDVELSVPIPAGYTLVRATPSAGTYDAATGIWKVSGLTSHTIGFLLIPKPAGPYAITLTVSKSSVVDPVVSNNSVTAATVIDPKADLRTTVFNFGGVGLQAPGTPFNWLVDVINDGPATAANVGVEFKLPSGFTLVSATPTAGTYDASTGAWRVPFLGANGTLQRLNLRVQLNATGPVDVRAAITASDAPDPNLANNVFVPDRVNRAPTANAGVDRAVSTNAPVTLDGSGSFDPDGDPITFEWVPALRPINSDSPVAGGATATPSFTPDLPGNYVMRLVVRDSFNATSAADTVAVSAIVTNRAPAFVSMPPVSGFTGEPYKYEANAIDPDSGDVLQFSLPTAPPGMTIDAQSGAIDWTPTAAQVGAHAVVVRVQDVAGLFAQQSFTVQVASPANGRPVAVDDDYGVRVTESLGIAAPGVAGNDTDESPLSARLVRPAGNGTALLNADGSFTYTPHTLLEGEFVLAENINLATGIPGVVVSGGTCNGFAGARCAFDDAVHTKWDSAGQPLDVVFPADVTVNRVVVVASRQPNDHKISAGIFELFAADGTELYDSGPVEILGPSFDATLILPNLRGVRRVRFTPSASPTSLFSVSLAELRVIGAGLMQRSVFVEPNLVQLLPATVQSSGVQGFNIAEALIDDSPANWFSTSNPGDFVEVTFPSEVRIRELIAVNPAGRPDGFGTSNGMICSGTFTFLDGNRGVLFDSGLVNEPSGALDGFDSFTLSVPDVAGVRHIRYTLSGCPAGFGLGFSEWRVFGSADVTRPAFSLSEKFQSLQGREAHSTPIVVNLTDDNGDGVIDADDVPDIAVPVESVGDQLRGEIKVISGDDGRELLTIGGPDLVSPWSELAAGDIDGDGKPEILAVSSAGNRLLAFEHDGTLKWQSSINVMPSFPIGSVSVVTGAIAIANLDSAGPPEIIVGASVFDANGVLLGDGRTLTGTTGGLGLRSAISAVGDIDLDGVPELVAGPTVYRLSGGTLTKVWQRTERPDAYVALANLDDDPQAEIVGVANGVVYALNHDGSDFEDWNAPTHAPLAIPGGGQGGAPLVVDVDGDGRPEIGVAGATSFVLFDRAGRVRWQAATSDRSSNATGAVAFDLNGDGLVEIIYRDERWLRVYRGTDGVLLARKPVGSATWSEEPVVADVDNDGHADIVVSSDFFQQSSEDTGIFVFQDVANKWKRTRRIWNQHAYHVTNVNEDATIPVEEDPHWLVSGLNGFRTNAFVPGESSDETDRFTYVVSDGVLESDEATVRIALRTPNAQPQFTSTPIASAAADVLYSYAAQAVDPDAADILTFSLPSAPPGMTIAPASGLIEWTPAAAQAGTHDVVVKVNDLRGLFSLQSYSVTVGSAVTVPDVVTQTGPSAAAAIAAAGLTVGAVSSRHSATAAEGLVISQNPAAGAAAAPLAPVSYVVSLGPPPVGVVPNVVGLLQGSAEADVAAAGFSTSIAVQSSSTIPAGVVITQNPTGGTSAPAGSAVALVVSQGPPPGELDLDGDGFTGDQGDCNDTNAAINPAAFDVAGDGIDQNCNGVDSIAGDTTLPVAAIDAPDDLAELTMPTAIVGTATDANFLRYRLLVAGVDDETFVEIGGGTSAVTAGALGTLDPTLRENGLYRVRLVVEDVNGQIAVDEQVYRLDGLAKPGHFQLSFVDLSVPVVGIPISIVRTYDSRVKSREAFGIGWTLEVARGRYRHNRTPGRGWIIRDQPFLNDFLPCIGGTAETLSHLTEVRLSDQESYTFALDIHNGNVGITGACEGTASFRFVDGTKPGATLEILDGTGVIYLRGGDDTVLDMNAFLEGTNRIFDPQRVRLTTADGVRIELTRQGGITRLEDRNGNTLSITPSGIVHSAGKSITFARDAANRITSITDPSGNHLDYVYDERGDLIAFSDATGNRTAFSYDLSHNLIEVVDPLGNRAGRTEYDSEGRLVAVVDASGNRIAIAHDVTGRQETVTDRLGGLTIAEYDERGNVLSRTNPLGETMSYTYDGNDNVLTEADALGHVRTFTYDERSNKLTETDPLGKTTTFTYNELSQELTRTDPRGGVSTNSYDAKGNLLTTVDPEGGVTRYRYDARGQVVSITDPAGAVRSFGYDESGRETIATDALGNVTQRAYDANGRLVAEVATASVGGSLQLITTRYVYDARGLLVATIDPKNGATATEYGPSGRPTSRTDPLGRQTNLIYDEQGRQIRVEHPDGTSEEFEYDAEGRRVRTIDAAGRGIGKTYDAAGRSVRTTNADGTTQIIDYDAAGRPVSMTDEKGQTTATSYDAAGRALSVTDPLGAVEVMSYDAMGNVTSRTDRNGHTTSYAYDMAGRLTRTTFADGTAISQTYDDAGRVVTRRDQDGNTTSYEYNLRGDLIAVVDPLGKRTTHAYDAVGNRIATTDAAARTTRYGYDAAGRLVTTTLPLGQTETRQYDAAGNLTATVDFNGDLALFGYDDRNRLTTRTLPASETHAFAYTPTGRIASTTDNRGVTTFGYDERERLTLVRQPDGREIQYGYDAAGNRSAVTTPAGTTRFTYDAAGRMTRVEDPSGNIVGFSHDAQGKPTQIAYPGGLVSAFAYDDLNRLTNVTHRKDGTVVGSYAYSLGARGQRLQVREHSGRQVDYTYDAVGRLVRESISHGGSTTATDYTYDAVGNRLTKSGSAGLLAYSYDGNHRLVAAGPISYVHDANGNLVGRTTGGGNTSYQYDFLGRLRQVTTPGGAVTRYGYDAFNQRIQRVTSAGTTNFLVDPAHPSGLSQVLLETDGSGQTTASYVQAGAVPIIQARAGQTTFSLIDGLSSTRLLADQTGITDTFDYDAFGNLLSRTGTTANPYQFNGQEFDASAGLYHLRAREYDPVTGRFAAVDPFSGVADSPATLHPYLYAQNDPVNLSDPSGEVTLAEVMFVANAVFTVATTAYDLYYGNYKSAAINVGLGVIPFGSLFKAVFRGGRAVPSIINLAADAPTQTGIVNLGSDAVTELARLAPEVATETAIVVENLGTAIGTLPEAAAAVSQTAVKIDRSTEALYLLISEGDEIRRMYNSLRLLYVQGANASDIALYMRRWIGQPGWEAKLCAVSRAHRYFTTQLNQNSTFGTTVVFAVNIALRGSGSRCLGDA